MSHMKGEECLLSLVSSLYLQVLIGSFIAHTENTFLCLIMMVVLMRLIAFSLIGRDVPVIPILKAVPTKFRFGVCKEVKTHLALYKDSVSPKLGLSKHNTTRNQINASGRKTSNRHKNTKKKFLKSLTHLQPTNPVISIHHWYEYQTHEQQNQF